jgi:hypothetical protein
MKVKLQLLSTQNEVHPSILVQETVIKFGYDPRYLKPNSWKLVVKQFNCCGKVEDRKFVQASKQHKCLNCSNQDNARGEAGREKRSISMKLRNLDPSYKHPTKGIGHTAESKKKMSKSHKGEIKSEATRAYFSARFTGKGNPFYGKKHSLELQTQINISRSASIKRGKNSNFYGRIYHGKGQWVECSVGRIWVRSSWELATVKYLDKQGLAWNYEPKAFKFKLNELEVTYTPDFYIEELGIYIEVKGYWREDAKAKFAEFKLQYPEIEIEVWDKQVLKERGIL